MTPALPHPADIAPRPSSELMVKIRASDDSLLEGLPGDYTMGWGNVVMDGSCSRDIIKDLNRAGWCLSLYDPGSEQPRVTISGPVWDPLPQTPQAAEHVAMAVVADIVTDTTKPVSDCLGVVRTANSSTVAQLKSNLKFAGVRRHALSRPSAHHLLEAEHIPAHRSDEVIAQLDEPERQLALANKAVDLAAKRARLESHPPLPRDKELLLEHDIEVCRHVCKAAAATLQLYPKQNLQKAPVPHSTLGRRQRAGWHDWKPFEGTWRCQHCLVAATDGTAHSTLALDGCQGRPRALRRLLATGSLNGHKLQRVDTAGGQPLFFCVSCGAWALTKCIKLMLPCERQAIRGTAGWDALRRIDRGIHPDYHGHAGERLTVAKRHAALEGARPPAPSTFRLLRPEPGSQLDAIRARVKEREQRSSASRDLTATTASRREATP